MCIEGRLVAEQFADQKAAFDLIAWRYGKRDASRLGAGQGNVFGQRCLDGSEAIGWHVDMARQPDLFRYSHSMVPGGFDVMS